jgi:ATP-dependent RNA helicase DeaD
VDQDGPEGDSGASSSGGSGAVSRGQNALYVMPHDWASIAPVIGPILERLDPQDASLQLVIITPDPDVTAAVGAAVVRLAADQRLDFVAATSSRRAGRLWRARPAHILAGDPQTLVDLVRAAALKLERVRTVALLWVDELLASGGGPHLETLMAELPKEAARTVVCAEAGPAVEELVERYARRARRVVAAAGATDRATSIEFVTVSPAARLVALRRLLDDIDPRTALVFARTEDSQVAVRDLLRSLGYDGPDAAIRGGLTAPPETEAVILYDLPATHEELREAAGPSSKRIIALVQPRQLTSLRALAGGGAVSPLTLPGAAERARGRDAATRAELRTVLAGGESGRELLTLEPLLDEYDGIEIAAAALQLLERERAAAAASASRPADKRQPRAASGTMVRLFVSVGSRDNVGPGDLVGAITSAAGVTGGEVGKVDIRESHTLVEVSASVADTVVEKLTGTMIRGRRATAKIDTERPSRPSSGRPSSGRPSAGRPPRDRGDRGDRRDGERGPRGGDRFGRGDDRAPRGAPRRRDRE